MPAVAICPPSSTLLYHSNQHLVNGNANLQITSRNGGCFQQSALNSLNTVPFLLQHITFLNFIPIRKHPWTLIVFLQASRAQPTMKEAWICHRGTQRNEGTWDKLPRDARDKTVVGRSTVGVEWVVTERNWKAK